MSKEEVIAAIRKATEELGYAPSQEKLLSMTKMGKHWIRKHFGCYRKALEACGLAREGSGYKADLASLFVDWAGVVRKLGKAPSMTEYELHAKYSTQPLTRHFGGWLHVPLGMLQYAREECLEDGWKDVLEVAAAHLEERTEKASSAGRSSAAASRPKLQANKTVYGTAMAMTPMVFEPTNEAGVAVLFGAVARELGFAIMHVQNGFPDCEAMREIEPGRCQRKRIEFEFQSRNFLAHLHPLDGCDLIVCWEDNWPDAPLEVLELKTAISYQQSAVSQGNCWNCQRKK